MRDADRRRSKLAGTTKQYAYALPPVLDDSDSCDADDEYSSDDGFVILSSDYSSEHCSIIDDEDSDGSLDIIDDYFDTLLQRLNRNCRDDHLEENEAEEACPPVIKFDLSKRADEALGAEVSVTTVQERTAALDCYGTVPYEKSSGYRADTMASQQNNSGVSDASDSDSWSLASSCFSDGWAEEIEFAEEDRAAREQEAMMIAKNRRDRKVTFCLVPTIINDLPLGGGYHQSIHHHPRR
ncbi:hypothetical protein PG990_006119 [Apiospora arundinis]|uniref:Uncharacterized protein n=1 Tax=Apiospora arundinis TaxID=335852 RepID=A0ABR2JAT1_9PEZI